MVLVAAMTLVMLGGCGSQSGGGSGEEFVPRVVGLSSTELSVGQTLYIVGEDFVDVDQGKTVVTFDGTFRRDSDGKFESTSFTVAPLFDGVLQEDTELGGVPVDAGMNVLRLSRFGPFSVPFSATGDQTGTFSGKLTVRNYLKSGTVQESKEPLDVTVTVRPSIVIRKLEPFVGYNADGTPVMANCGAPALRALQNLPYVLEVEAIGFEPEFFIYDFYGINGKDKEEVSYSHKAAGKVDRVGDPASGNLIVFNAVPEDTSFYYAAIRVAATVKGASGDFVETALPLSVHRALEFHMDQSTAVPAQYYQPQAMTGCIPGSIGSQVSYEESYTEERQNSVSVGVAKQWSSSHGTQQSTDWSEGVEETTSVSNESTQTWNHSEAETASESYGVDYQHSDSQSAAFSTSDGETWGWSYNEGTTNEEMQQKTGEIYGEVSGSITTQVGAEGSVPGFAKVSGSVSTEVGAMVGAKTGNTVGQTTGQHSDYGSSMESSSTSGEEYGSTTTDSVGESVDKSYALTSQDDVGGATSKTEASSSSKVYNFGGSTSVDDVVSVGDTETWDETWSSSTSHTTVVGTTNRIPVGKYGVYYRQTTRLVRKGQLYSHDLCGVRELMGELQFNEWTWAAGLAIGDECGGSTMPQPTTFPAAECVVPPCD